MFDIIKFVLFAFGCVTAYGLTTEQDLNALFTQAGETVDLPDWTPPPCPKCGADEMYHKLVSQIPSSKAFRTQNGWYCAKCNAGAFQLGNFSESDAAQFAVSLVNR